MVAQLGVEKVSRAVLVEAWVHRGGECDDVFFMHFDVLHNYQFLRSSTPLNKPVGFNQLMTFSEEQDAFVSITHDGQEFLHRFGYA